MASIDDIVAKMKENPKGVRFSDLSRVRDHLFGKSRSRGTSHQVYRTPWHGDPRVNIQNAKGRAKPYQVRQVLWALERLEKENG